MKDDDEDWDSETESLLDHLVRTMRDEQQKEMYPRKTPPSPDHGIAGKPDANCQYNDMLEALVHRVRVAADVEGQILAMRALASWLDDAADQLLAHESVDFHRSMEWH